MLEEESMTTWMWVSIVLAAWIVGSAGIGPSRAFWVRWWHKLTDWIPTPARRRRWEAANEKFVEDCIAQMIKKPKAVEAIYAQSQHHDSNPALVIAILALCLPLVFSVYERVDSANTWSKVALGLFTLFSMPLLLMLLVDGARSMHRTMTNAELYSKAIDSYCEHLGLPKRPR